MSDIWNTAFNDSPSGAKALGVVDDEIRALKSRLVERFQREFNFDLSSQTDQMVPLDGIAIPFVQNSVPTTRSNGSNFTSLDVGRLWLKHEYAAFTSTQPIGMYYLASADGAGTNVWRPMPDNKPIGSVEQFNGVFTNPSAGSPYDSGTKPGWFLANGATLDVAFPPGAATVPHYNNGRFPKAVSQNGSEASADSGIATGGANEVTITTANLPPHSHELDTGGNATLTIDVAGNHTHNIRAKRSIGSLSEGVEGDATGSVRNHDTDSAGAHLHTGSIGGNTETDQNVANPVFVNDPLSIDPQHTEVMFIVRMY